MPRVTLIYSHTNVIPKMNYSTEQPRSKTVKPNLGKEINLLSLSQQRDMSVAEGATYVVAGVTYVTASAICHHYV